MLNMFLASDIKISSCPFCNPYHCLQLYSPNEPGSLPFALVVMGNSNTIGTGELNLKEDQSEWKAGIL
jgi:hypothetical protein